MTRHPLTPRTAPATVALPKARLTSYEPIEVTLPAPDGESPSEERLVERFDQLAREHAERRERESGEQVEMGDEVLLDIIGYAQDKLIPFSIRTGWWMEMAPQEALPGFAEALAGSSVGECVGIALELPETYPVASLRGVRARFMIDIHAAREVVLPDPRSEDFLRELDRGGTLEEVMDSIAQELIEDGADQAWLQAQDRVLDVLASRLEVTLPPALIDEEIHRRWLAAEGQTVQDKDFSLEERAEAFDAWKTDAATRADVERRLRIALALKAVAERDGLRLEPGEVFEVLQKYMAAYGLKASEVHEALVTPETAQPLYDLAWHLRAVEHVMEQATLRFEGE